MTSPCRLEQGCLVHVRQYTAPSARGQTAFSPQNLFTQRRLHDAQR